MWWIHARVMHLNIRSLWILTFKKKSFHCIDYTTTIQWTHIHPWSQLKLHRWKSRKTHTKTIFDWHTCVSFCAFLKKYTFLYLEWNDTSVCDFLLLHNLSFININMLSRVFFLINLTCTKHQARYITPNKKNRP